MILTVSISHTLEFINQGYNMWSSSSWVDFIITGNNHFFLPTSSYASTTATSPCYGNNVMWFFYGLWPDSLTTTDRPAEVALKRLTKIFDFIHGRSIWMLRFIRMKREFFINQLHIWSGSGGNERLCLILWLTFIYLPNKNITFGQPWSGYSQKKVKWYNILCRIKTKRQSAFGDVGTFKLAKYWDMCGNWKGIYVQCTCHTMRKEGQDRKLVVDGDKPTIDYGRGTGSIVRVGWSRSTSNA